MELFELNPTVIYKDKIFFSASDEQNKILNNLVISETKLSQEMKLLEKKEFLPLKKQIEFHIKQYEKLVCGFSENLSLKITDSWYRETKPNEDHGLHDHPNSLLSGVVYLNIPKQDGYHSGINFETRHHIFKNFNFEYEIKNPSLYNTKRLHVSTETNNIILFPSTLYHYVTKNLHNEESRKIISFNTFIEGSVSLNNNFPSNIQITSA